MDTLKSKFFELLGVKPNELFGVYDSFDFCGNWRIDDELIMRPEDTKYAPNSIPVTAIIRGYFTIGKIQ